MSKGKPEYIQLIKEYGLDFGNRIRNDIDAYIIVVVLIEKNTGIPHIEIIKEVSKD